MRNSYADLNLPGWKGQQGLDMNKNMSDMEKVN